MIESQNECRDWKSLVGIGYRKSQKIRIENLGLNINCVMKISD